MEKMIEVGIRGVAAEVELRSRRDRTAFQWGGTICALFLLILNRTGRRSALQTTLLVLYLFASFPTVLFKILRGQFGYWIAFLAVAANLFFPETFQVSRFVLFVIAPDWLSNGLRDPLAGGIFCLLMAVLLLMARLREIGGLWGCEYNFHCISYCLVISLLFFFTGFYLFVGGW
ncbi:cold-regulated 413 plasma membrane protein 4 [Manihot esculenta]|uniref:Uncharacterized protein n=1 Tax=Manihot esculenta TaxID=3983 RepID=A0A2C9USP5_MANES|nr:cold-regulated 413 plasma membrane protein 4 [Manihot esculenta]OAY33911.1 hypothetical protein MANES_13G135100v8 [Manihot esculenta]